MMPDNNHIGFFFKMRTVRLRIILPSLCSNVDARERALCGLILTPQSGVSVSVTGERAGGAESGALPGSSGSGRRLTESPGALWVPFGTGSCE